MLSTSEMTGEASGKWDELPFQMTHTKSRKHPHTHYNGQAWKYLMRLHSSTSDFVTRESLHVKHGVNRPREAVMTPAEEELRGEGGREQE